MKFITYINVSDNQICFWCGKSYKEHLDKPDDKYTSKCPCGMLKSNFGLNLKCGINNNQEKNTNLLNKKDEKTITDIRKNIKCCCYSYRTYYSLDCWINISYKIMNKLHHKFIDFAYMNKNFPYMTPEQCEEIYNWINQNYISKEEILNLECLKEEEFDVLMTLKEVQMKELERFGWSKESMKLGANKLRNEIKQQIIDYKNK